MKMLQLILSSILLLGVELAHAAPHPSLKYITHVERAEQIQSEYDYVIVGAGTAGLTVGDRLTEDGRYTVLVIENGALTSESGMNPSRMYDITSASQPNLNNRSFYVGIGNVVGGSSRVNGQVMMRGSAEDFELWADLIEDPSWGWDGMLPYFLKGTYFTPPREDMARAFNITYDPAVRGQMSGTRVYEEVSVPFLADIKTFYNALRAMPNMPVPLDGGAGTHGLYWFTSAMNPNDKSRSDSRTGHWDNVNRNNYELITQSKVTNINFDGTRASGVTFRQNNNQQTVRARKEVILAAGAIHTPQLLQLSGIGPASLLRQAGISVKLDLPGVGNNFQDHSYISSIPYEWGTTPPAPDLGGVQVGWQPGSGNPALGAFLGLPDITPSNFESLARKFSSQDPSAYLPSNTDPTVLSGYRKQHAAWARSMRSRGTTFLQYMVTGQPGGGIQNLHPASRGTVFLNPSNPRGGEPVVDYRAASNPIDIDVMVENVKWLRRLMTTGELARYGAREVSPGSGVSSDAQIADWVRGQITPSVFHPCGTTAMMRREDGGVVDGALKVYGLQGLRIVDAGVMPTIVGATICETVYAVAEKAADLIKADQ